MFQAARLQAQTRRHGGGSVAAGQEHGRHGGDVGRTAGDTRVCCLNFIYCACEYYTILLETLLYYQKY